MKYIVRYYIKYIVRYYMKCIVRYHIKYIVRYYIKWVTTSWTYSNLFQKFIRKIAKIKIYFLN